MARPKKTALDFFPFDVDFFDDDKISAVFVEFGIKGEITAVKLLCAIYRNGYFIEWRDSVRIHMLRLLPGVSRDLLEQIVRSLVRWRFFDPDMFFTHHVLTSRAIQRRYFQLAHRNKRLLDTDQPYLLDYNTDDDATPLAAPVPQVADHSMSEQKMADELRKSPLWLEQMAMRHQRNTDDIVKLIDEFLLDNRCREKTHTSTQDMKRHFNDWLLIQDKIQRQSNGQQKRKPSKKVTATATDFKASF